MSSSSITPTLGIDYPELVVFDLDACLWDKEMFEMDALPSRTVKTDLNGMACAFSITYICYGLIQKI